MPSESPVCSTILHEEALNITCFQDVKGCKNLESPTERVVTVASGLPTSPESETFRDSSPSPSKSSSSSESPTFRDRLRSARKLIPEFPGRARLFFSTSDSNEISKEEKNVKSKTRSSDGFRCFLREHYIFTEFQSLCMNHQDGVYVMPSLKSIQVWHGIIFLRAGAYRDGIFRFFVFLPDDFPVSRPVLKFTTPVFHPQIHPNGVLNLDIAFPIWKKEKYSVWQIIKFMKNCFYNADTWGATNQAAMNVMHNSLEEFVKKARYCALQSQVIFEKEMEFEYSVDDGNFLKVKKMSNEEFEEGKKQMMQGVSNVDSPQKNLPSSRNYASH